MREAPKRCVCVKRGWNRKTEQKIRSNYEGGCLCRIISIATEGRQAAKAWNDFRSHWSPGACSRYSDALPFCQASLIGLKMSLPALNPQTVSFPASATAGGALQGQIHRAKI
jgi:hypothetical protein